jgi:hypothetical protein
MRKVSRGVVVAAIVLMVIGGSVPRPRMLP